MNCWSRFLVNKRPRGGGEGECISVSKPAFHWAVCPEMVKCVECISATSWLDLPCRSPSEMKESSTLIHLSRFLHGRICHWIMSNRKATCLDLKVLVWCPFVYVDQPLGKLWRAAMYVSGLSALGRFWTFYPFGNITGLKLKHLLSGDAGPES